jgi:hypothetical protein
MLLSSTEASLPTILGKSGFIEEAHLQSYRLNIAKKNDFTAFLSSLD